MNVIRNYLEYLRDNPDKYWCKRKLYGWGWEPARLPGWLTLLAYLVGVVFFTIKAENVVTLWDATRQIIAPIIILTILFFFICYQTGEKPKWQWGERRE